MSMKYLVISILSSSASEYIEAESPEVAANKAPYPILCHQCSSDVDLGDIDYVEVMNEDSEKVYTTEEKFSEEDEKKFDEIKKRSASWETNHKQHSHNKVAADRAELIGLINKLLR